MVSIGTSVNTKWKLSTRFNDKFGNVQRRVNDYGLRVLYQMGGYTRRTMSRMLSKRPPAQYTKTGRESVRYRREVKGKAERPPYSKQGRLHKQLGFEVDKVKRSVRVGPELVFTRSEVQPSLSTIPALLDQGGTASVNEAELQWQTARNGRRYRSWKRTGRKIKTTYRAFPFTIPAREKAIPAFKRKLGQEKL